MTQAVLSLSDSFFYPAPVLLELDDFKQVQASVFQVARAPGKTLVYLGAVLLIVGVFAMLYIRERRLWIWLAPPMRPHGAATNITAAMSTTRRTLDADAEFERLKRAISRARKPDHEHAPPSTLGRPPAASSRRSLVRLAVRRCSSLARRRLRLQPLRRVDGRATRRRSWSARCRLLIALGWFWGRCAC